MYHSKYGMARSNLLWHALILCSTAMYDRKGGSGSNACTQGVRRANGCGCVLRPPCVFGRPSFLSAHVLASQLKF
eukprot:187487-Karenia_brevis.AAC.1